MSDPQPAAPAVRLASIDAYRGLVMFLMMAEVLHFGQVALNLPGNPVWAFLAHHQDHVEWVGCSLHDLIQPSFSFLVGTALAFSVANRQARGQGAGGMMLHAAWRALVLIALGIFLRSVNKPMTNFTFEDTLTQIGLGYLPLFLLGFRPRRDQWLALGLILGGVWFAFAIHPIPADFDYARVGVDAEWMGEHGLTGFEAHWQKNSNLAWAVDTWFLNQFPRPEPFEFNSGGYATLSFVPTLGTMVLGLIAGGMLRSEHDAGRKVRRLLLLGVCLLAAGWLVGWLGLCPVVKRIWTPSWVLFSGGWCFLFMGAFHLLVDVMPGRGLVFPLIVIGMNSIAAYCIAHLWDTFVINALKTHLGAGIFEIAGPEYVPLVRGAGVLLVFWLILFWMYQKKVFVKI